MTGLGDTMQGHGLSDALSPEFYPRTGSLRVNGPLCVGQGGHHCSVPWDPLWGCRLVGKGAVTPVLGSGWELCSVAGQSPGHHHIPKSSGGWTSTHTGVVVAAVREPEGRSICTPES